MENNPSFEWESKNWVIAETTLPAFQIGKTKVAADTLQHNIVNYVQKPK